MNTSLVDTIDLTYENFVLEGAKQFHRRPLALENQLI